MIAKFQCQTCDEAGEIKIDHTAWLVGVAEELCPYCASIMMQSHGEIFVDALHT